MNRGMAALLVAAATFAATSDRAAQDPKAARPVADKPYTVECGPDPDEGRNVCRVDRGTYVGWRTFHAICHTCHAQDAVGSTFAPSLLERMTEIAKTAF